MKDEVVMAAPKSTRFVGIIISSISATILETGRPALFVSGWFAKMLTAATVVCTTQKQQ